MPIVNLAIVPELMNGDRQAQYRDVVQGITEAIVQVTGAPEESVHVLIEEVHSDMYSVGGVMLQRAMPKPD
ncbi:2-hydroxymuconate tautomerase [Rothia sp. HC945]|uniref:2-hydroxymuconate tautomerase n=1 Tax=Rothia sp. HC945 TaxID=3171170 RepID=UPI003F203B69